MVNLMDNSSPQAPPTNLIVDVKDHDIDVPKDLKANNTPFWQQDGIKLWLYILAGAAVILITVFALLSKQTSLFQGRTKLSSSNTVSVETPENSDLEDFNSQAANAEEEISDENNEDKTLNGEGDFDRTQVDETDQADINDILDITNENPSLNESDLAVLDSNDSYNDGLEELLDEELDILGATDSLDANSAPVTNDDPFGQSDSLQSHGAAQDETTIESEIINGTQEEDNSIGPNLNSNTSQEVLASPDMQGDTGPSLYLSLIPALLYAFKPKKNALKI